MVKGLALFRDWFAGFEDCYALIGGAACELCWLLLSLAPAEKLILAGAIRVDLRDFIDRLPPQSPAWASIRASLASNNFTLPPPREAIKRIQEIYGLQ